MPLENSPVYESGPKFVVSPPDADGEVEILFEYQVDSHNRISRPVTQEDKDRYPAEYADFLERPKREIENKKQEMKQIEEQAKLGEKLHAEHDKAAKEQKEKDKEAKEKAKLEVKHEPKVPASTTKLQDGTVELHTPPTAEQPLVSHVRVPAQSVPHGYDPAKVKNPGQDEYAKSKGQELPEPKDTTPTAKPKGNK